MMKIQARNRRATQPKSIDEVVAEVPKPPELIELEAELEHLRARRDALLGQECVAREARGDHNKHEIDQLLSEIVTERTKIDAAIVAVRRRHAAARAEHGAAVKLALEAHRTSAEVDFREAYHRLLAAWRVVDRVRAECRRAGAQVPAAVPLERAEPLARYFLFGASADSAGFAEAKRKARPPAAKVAAE